MTRTSRASGGDGEVAVLRLSTRADGLVPAAFLASLVALVLLLDGWGWWALVPFPTALVAGWLLSPPSRLSLVDDALVLEGRSRSARIALDDITTIHVHAPPFSGEHLVIASALGDVRIDRIDAAADFLHALGVAMGPRAHAHARYRGPVGAAEEGRRGGSRGAGAGPGRGAASAAA